MADGHTVRDQLDRVRVSPLVDSRHFLIDTVAHMPPGLMLADLTESDAHRKLPNSHSIAEIVAHMDFWQRWFRARCSGDGVAVPANAGLGWPEPGPWVEVRDRFIEGLELVAKLAEDGNIDRPIEPAIDFPPLANYTVRDALVHAASHNSHHLGQIVTLRQVAGLWPPPNGSWTW